MAKKDDTGEDLLAQVRKAALAEAEADNEEKPDTIEIDGVTYYRHKQPELPAAKLNAKGEEIIPVLINIAPHSPFLRIDNRIYHHGMSYWFTEKQAASVYEMMYNSWRHERATGGANVLAGSSHDMRMSGRTGAVTTSRMGAPGVPGL